MKNLQLRLVDENENQRRTYTSLLNIILKDSGVTVVPMSPLASKEDYALLLVNEMVSGFILDQKLEDGGFNYTGAELATYIRSIDSKIPIVILTNYASEREQFEGSEKDVEYIYSKKQVSKPNSPDAQVIKARLLRRLNVFVDVRDARQERFRELLVKSIEEDLSDEEKKEMGVLKEERLLPIQAVEAEETASLTDILNRVNKIIGE